MKQEPKSKPKSDLAKTAGRALKRAAKQARVTARQYGTPVHVQSGGVVVALKSGVPPAQIEPVATSSG